MKSYVKYIIKKNSHWTYFTIVLVSLLVIYFYLYLSTDFRHILVSTDLVLSHTEQRGENNSKRKLLKEPMFLEFSEVMIGPISQEDRRLIKYIQKNYLKSPAPSHVSYNLSEEATNKLQYDPSFGQSREVLKVLGQMSNGFFIEAGAFDGELRSNTLFLEQNLGWTGLLVEPDPKNFKLLSQKKRKAWSINSCLSTKPYPHQVVFYQKGSEGRIIEKFQSVKDFSLAESPIDLQNVRRNRRKNYIRVQCIPIYSILLALNRTTIDYFSLDVEGAEIDIIKTIPFNKIFIKVFSVEFPKAEGSDEKLLRFMKSKGFTYYSSVIDYVGLNYANDFIFVNSKLFNSTATTTSALL